ncbi:hypothetical protein PTSG_06568 [Salpingoeca rosetta]|uniref:WDR11 TPR domain-containing protein n=1 Tax=Salpingoeca rosetta (strain ATCC 50818 / BSB-021) TaxID=946362 RepID=F2UG65_SALR5|nr:uncharacterized protein PTSG_06568 [Salpingoeca rosetta]EGD75493.1 hypothetical protein PTSG_06568 [Salpingoeca rosetta]|eukprot:XP_004991950.1 hypothetical protein PTSG_06568 [Salpingoeca rosetta]
MRGKTAAVSSSSDGVQWGTTGFVAFPRSNVVLIADPRALQVVQHLHGHRYPITQVRWEELAEPLTQRMPRLLTGDDRGVVYVWNVEEHESKMFPAPFLKGSKGYSVLDLAWLPNKVHDEPPQFLVLYANHMLVGFNTAGRQLWTHDYSSYAPLQFALNPYNSSQAVMALPDSCVLIVDDISASSPPRAKPTDLHVQPRGDTGGLRHLSFNRHEEHQVVLAFAHQLVVLDLLVHRPVATVHLDRSSSAFRSVASCPHSPVLYCLHDNHSISIRSRLDQASMTYSFTGQSEALRLKTDTLLGIAVNPLNERQLCTATDAGALLLFNPHTSPVSTVPISRSAASAARFGHKVLVRALLSAMHQPTKDEYTLPADASDHLARDDVYAKTRALLALLPPSTHRQLTAAPSIAHRCLAACHAFGDAWAASFWRLVLCTPPSHNAVGSSQEQQGGGLDLLSLEEGNATLQQSSGVTTADAAGSHNHGDEADGDGKDETKEQQHQQEQQDNEGEDDEEEDVHDSADTARQLPVEFGSLRSTSLRCLVIGDEGCAVIHPDLSVVERVRDRSHLHKIEDAAWLSDDRLLVSMDNGMIQTFTASLKIAAMNLIAADRITEGVDLLVTIGHIRDACKYLQAYGRWAEAVDLAKTRLSTQAAHAVVEEYATHLCSHRQFGEAALHFVTTNNTDRAVECLRSMQQPHMAALFLLHRKHELDKTAAAADVSASSSSAPHDQQQQHHQHHQHHQQQQVSAPLATCDRLAAGPPPKSAVFLDYARLLNRFSLDQEAKWVCRHFAKLPISHLEDA